MSASSSSSKPLAISSSQKLRTVAKQRVDAYLTSHDPNQTTLKHILTMLCESFQVDNVQSLPVKKDTIREWVIAFLDGLQSHDQENEEEPEKTDTPKRDDDEFIVDVEYGSDGTAYLVDPKPAQSMPPPPTLVPGAEKIQPVKPKVSRPRRVMEGPPCSLGDIEHFATNIEDGSPEVLPLFRSLCFGNDPVKEETLIPRLLSFRGYLLEKDMAADITNHPCFRERHSLANAYPVTVLRTASSLLKLPSARTKKDFVETLVKFMAMPRQTCPPKTKRSRVGSTKPKANVAKVEKVNGVSEKRRKNVASSKEKSTNRFMDDVGVASTEDDEEQGSDEVDEEEDTDDENDDQMSDCEKVEGEQDSESDNPVHNVRKREQQDTRHQRDGKKRKVSDVSSAKQQPTRKKRQLISDDEDSD